MGNWQNTDNLYLKFGTTKAAAENWGEYKTTGGTRIIEGLLDISTLSTIASSGANILSDTLIFSPSSGANSNSMFIEKVELVAETAMSSTVSTISIGLIQDDRVTTPTSYSSAIVASVAGATLVQGALVTLGATISTVGNLVGQLAATGPASSTGPYYLTGSVSNPNLTGKIRVRIHYRGIGTITQ